MRLRGTPQRIFRPSERRRCHVSDSGSVLQGEHWLELERFTINEIQVHIQGRKAWLVSISLEPHCDCDRDSDTAINSDR